NVNTTGLTAIPGRDYSIPATITFAPGETNKALVVVVTNRISVKPIQDFEVDIYSSEGLPILNGSAMGTIVTAAPGKLDHFTWNLITSPKTNGLPFNITISARDYNEALATNFNAAATLNGFYVGGFRTNVLLGSVDTGNPNSMGSST